ncbi:MAG: tetratricopeptide repeat protein [Gammaproteobacteria bacterium]
MENRSGRHSNDETKSQYSIGRRSVGTAHTARSVLDLNKVLNGIYSQYGTDTDHEDIAEVLYEAGLANFLEKNYSKAADHLNIALNMYRNLQVESDEEDTHESEIAETLKILGMVYLARTEIEKARQDYPKASKENEKARNHFELALTKKQKIYGIKVINTDIAELERYLGLTYLTETSITTDQTPALTHLTNALRYFTQIYGEDADHVEIADTYCHLGCAYQQQGEYDKARAQFTAALTMYQEVSSDPNQVKIAETFYKIGLTYMAVSTHDKAISSFTKAFNIYTENRQTNPTIDPNYVDLSFHLGKAYSETSDFDLAKHHLESAWLMYQALYRSSNPSHPSIQAAALALSAVEEKRAAQSSEAPARNSTSVPTQKRQQTSAAVSSADDSPSKQSRTNRADKSVPKSVSVSGFFAQPTITAQASTNQKEFTKADIQAFYLSKAGVFNASSSIFKAKTLEESIAELRRRAGNGGASAATLKNFGYSLT